MASFSWHKRILKALAVLTTCTTYTKEDRYVDVTMFTEIGGEGRKIDYRKRGSADLSRFLLPQAYQTQVNVNALQIADLLKVCKCIPNDKCAFYDNLCIDNCVIVRNI